MKTVFVIRFFLIGNMSLAFCDSAINVSGVYGINMAGISMLFLLLSYYTMLYYKKTMNIAMTERPVRAAFWFLKSMAFLIALAPLFVSKTGQLSFFHIHTDDLPKRFGEVLKIIGMGGIIDVCLWIEKKMKEKK